MPPPFIPQSATNDAPALARGPARNGGWNGKGGDAAGRDDMHRGWTIGFSWFVIRETAGWGHWFAGCGSAGLAVLPGSKPRLVRRMRETGFLVVDGDL